MTVTFMIRLLFLGRLLGRRLFGRRLLRRLFLGLGFLLGRFFRRRFLWLLRGFEREGTLAHEQVVPLHELLQIALVHAVVVEFGDNAVDEVTNGLRSVLVRRTFGAFLGVVHAVEDVQQGHIVIVGVHGDVCEVADAGGAGHA